MEKTSFIHTADLLDGRPTRVTGQGVLPGMQAMFGMDAVSTKLSIKHETFCWEYVNSAGDRITAYQRAYPKAKASTARINSSILLTKPQILQRVAELQAEMRGRHSLIADHLVEQHARAMTLDHTMVATELVTVEQARVLPPEVRELLEADVSFGKDGDSVISFRLPSKHQARQELAKIMGLNKDRLEMSGPDGGPIQRLERVVMAPADYEATNLQGDEQ